MAGVPFDQLDGHIWMNGEFVPWKDAKVHVLTHGLHYASAVFEGERAYNGRIFEGVRHSERLLKSGEMLDMPMRTAGLFGQLTFMRVAVSLFSSMFVIVPLSSLLVLVIVLSR